MGVHDTRIITALETMASAAAGAAEIDLNITEGKLATGGPLLVFASGATTDPMLALSDSEALNVRWNNHAAPTALWKSVALPRDLNSAYPITLSFLCSKSGATVGDAVTLLVAAYIIATGALHNADANCGGTTGAMTGDATALRTTTLTHTIAAADVLAALPSGGPGLLNFSVKPTDGTLGTDDFCLHSGRLLYTRRSTTSIAVS